MLGLPAELISALCKRTSLPSPFQQLSLYSLCSWPYSLAQLPTLSFPQMQPGRKNQASPTLPAFPTPPTSTSGPGVPPVLRGWQGVPSRSVCCQPPLALLLQNGLW